MGRRKKSEENVAAETEAPKRGRKSKANGASNGVSVYVNGEKLDGVLADAAIDIIEGAETTPTPAAPAPKRTRYLECKLSQRERRFMGKAIAETLAEAEEANQELNGLKEQCSDVKKRAEVLITRAQQQARELIRGVTHREVECHEEEGPKSAVYLGEPDTMGMITFRDDTGEPIEWRELNKGERQGVLFDEGPRA